MKKEQRKVRKATLKESIRYFKRLAATALKEYLYYQNLADDLVNGCKKHLIVKTRYGATCDICEKDFGWWCDKSPDHVCHYFTEPYDAKNGKVLLVSGKKIKPPAHKYESLDNCLFCGEPEERK